MQDLVTATLLLAATAAFAVLGLRHRNAGQGLDDYLVARNTFSARTGAATLLASTFGAWLLFSPAEAATWGGGMALLGYALGVAAPRLVMIPLGTRMRRLVVHGRGLSEFVLVRYGSIMYVAVLIVMISYLAVAIAAEATATVRVIAAVSDLPAWLPASVTLAASVLYTGVGGLRASVVTDRAQMWVITPFLLIILAIGLWVLARSTGAQAVTARPWTAELVLGSAGAWETGGALFLAILFTGILNQGNWQRVFALQGPRAVRQAMVAAALISAPVVLLMGGFGLLHQVMDLGQPSAAVFAVLTTVLPKWMLVMMAVLAVALVLSSMDTALNAVASLVVVALRTARPHWPAQRLVAGSVVAMVVAALFALYMAIQGYSVLYLFLAADLLCAAVAVPVFAGLFLDRYGARLAICSLIAGLVAGISLFPPPDLSTGSLFWSFATAFLVPLAMLPLCWLGSARRFDFDVLGTRIQPYND